MRFRYLTEKEAEMPLNMAVMQLVLGLQSCETKGDAKELLFDAVELGKKQERKDLQRLLKSLSRYKPEFCFDSYGMEYIDMEKTEDGDYIEIKQLLSMLDSGVERGNIPSKEE